jgi:quinol monooxygenase YgiN
MASDRPSVISGIQAAVEEPSMSKAALFITHKALPGKRDEVRRVWEKHLRPNIAENPAHEAYFYCYDDADPDVICVFQQYVDHEAPKDFVKAPWYAAYSDEVSPLLAGPPEIRAATPMWAKRATT